jgi:DNA (cytosine-5)-methyltransferase 1
MKMKDRRKSQSPPEPPPLTAIDIFAGGGGLTVGMKRTGFAVVGAVEIEKHAFSTYKTNHPEVCAFRQDIRTVSGKVFLRLSPSRRIDLLAGCPPCQGFSSLTNKYAKEDPRNRLILEMSRLITEIQPRAVMMENVPGLASKGKPLFDQFLVALSASGYIYDYAILQVADYGVPQSRRRLVLLAGKGMRISMPEITHGPRSHTQQKQYRSIRTVIAGMPSPVTLQDSLLQGGPQVFNWHVVRNLSDRNKVRLSYAKQGKTWKGIPEEVRPACHKSESAGFQNVYGRMSWEQPSPTITGGCTTFSKGRFGHPDENRTISVREAALLQTFPPDYVIDTPYMDHACDIIGNALPCDFAEIMARQVYRKLQEHESMAQIG